MGQCCCCGTYKPSEQDEIVLPNTPADPKLPEKSEEKALIMDYDKSFTVYTSTTDPRKILKHHAQLLLTVTPRDQSNLFITQTPIAWKVLDFPPQSDIQLNFKWHAEQGFAVSGRFENSIPVPSGQSGVLTVMGGGPVWNVIQGRRGKIMARNETGIPQTFTLGSIDENDDFEAFVRFIATPTGGAITADPAVMLQIYTVTNYQPGRPLSQVDSNAFLLKKYDQTAGPVDITNMQNGTSFLVHSGATGRLAIDH